MKALLEAIDALEASADDTGCSGDLTVVSAAAVKMLVELARDKRAKETPADTVLEALLQEVRVLEEADVWGEHPTFTRDCWQTDAGDGDTNLGYWDWVRHRVIFEYRNLQAQP